MKFLLNILPLAALALGWSDPLPCSGVCVNTHDPSIIQRSSDGLYFRFATGQSMPIFTGDSIQGPWEEAGEVLPPGSGDNWAPDVQELDDGTYVLYYSRSTFGTQESWIGVATSSDLETWVDQGPTGVASKEGDAYNAIDANLFQPADGSNILTFGSFWDDIFQTGVSEDGLTWDGSAPNNIQYNSTGSRAAEGPYLFANGDFYYLFFSAGKCCGYDADMPAPGEEYKIMVCRSSSPTGPFEDAEGVPCTQNGGTLVLGSHDDVYGPGGQGVLGNTEQGDVLYYHYVKKSVGFGDGQKQLGVNIIDWSSGWPVV